MTVSQSSSEPLARKPRDGPRTVARRGGGVLSLLHACNAEGVRISASDESFGQPIGDHDGVVGVGEIPKLRAGFTAGLMGFISGWRGAVVQSSVEGAIGQPAFQELRI